jgi:hypothetical protein
MTKVKPVLNDFAALASDVRTAFRLQLIRDFANGAVPPSCQIALADAITHLPMRTNNYVDFYSSLEHAQNVRVYWNDARLTFVLPRS